MIKLTELLNEDWSQKYKNSIDCNNPKGFSQKAHCAGKEKRESVNESTPDQVIKDLDKAKNDLLKKVDALIAKKKKLYSDVDIEAPMSADEKKLDKDIADLFSQINKLVLQKRSVKKESIDEGVFKIGVKHIIPLIPTGYAPNDPKYKSDLRYLRNMLNNFYKERGYEKVILPTF